MTVLLASLPPLARSYNSPEIAFHSCNTVGIPGAPGPGSLRLGLHAVRSVMYANCGLQLPDVTQYLSDLGL